MPIQADSLPAESSEKFNARSEWLPIGTAPHNESILLAWKDWRDGRWVMAVGAASTGTRYATGYSTISYHSSATHWMPLPSPPGAELNISNEPERTAVSLKPKQSDAGKTEGETG